MTDQQIENQGREAARSARRRSECPHQFGPKRKAWLKGYDQVMSACCA